MKIYVIGTSGSGKSTLARIISQKLNIKHIELDTFLFLPGWIKRPREDYMKDIEAEMEAKDWVLCGNLEANKVIAMYQADQIVWLNYPFYKVFWQTLKRTFKRILFKVPCCNGNYETFYMQFCTKYSIFWWVITTHPKRKREYLELREDPKYKDKWVTIHNQRELDAYIDKLA